MLKILYADRFRLPPAISAQFTFDLCALQLKIASSLKPHILGVHGCSKLSILLIPP